MIVPLLVHLALQYVPLLTVGVIPFVGPSAALVGFMINLVHMIMVLAMVIPLSTWLFQLTGNIYTGAIPECLACDLDVHFIAGDCADPGLAIFAQVDSR